jgi:copper chaperone CopZ
MAYQYNFRIEDVTCEKCDQRIQEALACLPGTQQIDYVRTPRNEAEVVLITNDSLSSELIEEAIAQKSVGTTHQYHVRWGDL